ncbi:MAG: hypothetical protein MI785_04415 [Kiloniellales bacterium]|nr:hypothetical protein [Kiloniellales bacterium]
MKAVLAEPLLESRLLQAVADCLRPCPEAPAPEAPADDTPSLLEARLAAAIAGAGLLRRVVRTLIGGLPLDAGFRPAFTFSLLLTTLQPGHRPGLRSAGAGGGGPGR